MEPDIELLLDMEPFAAASAASASPAKPAVNRTRAAIFPIFFIALSFKGRQAPCPAPFAFFSRGSCQRLQPPRAKFPHTIHSRGLPSNRRGRRQYGRNCR